MGTGVEVSDTDPVRDGNDGTDQLDGVETLSFADGELTLSMAGGEIQVNTYTAGNQLTPRVAGLSDGGSIVTWQSAGQDGSGLGVYAQRFDAALHLTFQPGNPDHRKLVEIARRDGQEAQPLEQRIPLVLAFGQDTAIEGQPAQFAIGIAILGRKLRKRFGVIGRYAGGEFRTHRATRRGHGLPI